MQFQGNTRFVLLFTLCSTFTLQTPNLLAQTAPPAPKVFLDCQTRCFFDHIRSELSYLSFMRDRQTADVYLLLTSLRTGSGGREWTLIVKGQHRFAGRVDTLVFHSSPDATDGQIQDLQVEKIQLALVPFLLKTSLADHLNLSVEAPSREEALADSLEHDPWNFWVFNVGGNMNFNGQEASSHFSFRGRFSASRVTEQSKFNLWLNGNFNRRRFSLTEEEFITRIYGGNVFSRYVYSVSDHFSAGAQASLFSSTIENYDLALAVTPAVEYNLFPYAEATKRQFTLFYSIGPNFNNYQDSTIYNVEREWLVRQRFEVNYRQIEEWGRLDFEVRFSNYLHNWDFLSLSFNPNVEWNLFRGFNIEFGGVISLVRDQLNIPKGDASDEEILLELRALSTSYFYFGYAGINYRFGSQQNNVVNTRF